jgi:nicotinate-nucleotide pyrophosphorylase (carboxylating)
MFFCRFACVEGSKIPTFAGFGIFLARIKSILTCLQLPNHTFPPFPFCSEIRVNRIQSVQANLTFVCNLSKVEDVGLWTLDIGQCPVNPSMNNDLPAEIIISIQRALEEDIGNGDATTNSIVPETASLKGKIVAKQNGVVAGLDVARAVFLELNRNVIFNQLVPDGSEVENKTIIATVEGSARALLTGERTALNFLGRMSGIATLTRQFVKSVADTDAQILDTRKTAPGLRLLDKRAVLLGGGKNHRAGLFDMILIKDNHIDFAGSITTAVERARSAGLDLEIEVETRTIEDIKEALDLGVKRILLDNMDLETMKRAAALAWGRAKLEASGNITLQNVSEVARTRVDYISVGALTHSPKVFDVSLEWSENVLSESRT